MRTLTLCLLFVVASLIAGSSAQGTSQEPTPPFNQCAPVGQSSSCAILIVIDADGSLRIFYDPSQGVYDGIEDTLVGVQNDSTHTVLSIPLAGGQPIFGFDGDGICGIDPLSFPPKPFDPAPAGCPFGPTGYEGPGVSFTVADAFNGYVNFAGGLKTGASAYFGLEGAIQTKCMGIQGVPLIKQGDPKWGSQLMADPKLKLTIGNFGCYLTDLVMTVNYYASQSGSSFRTDPSKLNTWLLANKGYNKAGFIIPNAVIQYAAVNGFSISYRTVDHRDDFVVDSLICSQPQQPPMLLVGQPHWVIPTDQTISSGGFDTYKINDPGVYPFDDTLEPWAFTYRAIDIYTLYPATPAGLYVFVHSPLDVYVTGPDGLRKGVNPNSNTSYNEILGASYRDAALVDDTAPSSGTFSPSDKVLYIPHPADGAYSLTTTGTGTGPYEIEIYAYDSQNGLSVTTPLTGEASKGAVKKYDIHYSSIPGSQVTVVGSIFGDVNNDGVVNCADLTIVKASFGKKTGQAGFDARADVNGDGVVNILDLSAVARQLPAGTVCH